MNLLQFLPIFLVTTSVPWPVSTVVDFPDLDVDVKPSDYRLRVDYLGKEIHFKCDQNETAIDEKLYVKRHDLQVDGQRFELFQAEYFKWAPGYKSGSLQVKGAVLAGFSASGAPLFPCRQHYSYQIGVASLFNGICYTAYDPFGQPHFDILTNPHNLKYSWINVTNWNSMPNNAVTLRRTYRSTKYIGRIQVASGAVVLIMPGLEVIDRVENSTDQVLVVGDKHSELEYIGKIQLGETTGEPIQTLICHNVDKFTPNDSLVRKVATVKSFRFDKDIQGTVEFAVLTGFKFGTKLRWVDGSNGSIPVENAVVASFESNGSPLYICRCANNCHFDGFEKAPKKLTGYLSLHLGQCVVTFANRVSYFDAYQVLTNLLNYPLVWKQFNNLKPLNNGAVIGARSYRQTPYFIAKADLAHQTVVGYIDLDQEKFNYIDESGSGHISISNWSTETPNVVHYSVETQKATLIGEVDIDPVYVLSVTV